MSRDFTPRDLYVADQMLQLRGSKLRGRLMMVNTKTGEEIRLDNHLAADRYPELSFLFSGFDALYKEVREKKEMLSFLDIVERRIVALENGEMGEEDEVQLWYLGKLDQNFYYSEENNRLFLEYLENAGKTCDA